MVELEISTQIRVKENILIGFKISELKNNAHFFATLTSAARKCVWMCLTPPPPQSKLSRYHFPMNKKETNVFPHEHNIQTDTFKCINPRPSSWCLESKHVCVCVCVWDVTLRFRRANLGQGVVVKVQSARGNPAGLTAVARSSRPNGSEWWKTSSRKEMSILSRKPGRYRLALAPEGTSEVGVTSTEALPTRLPKRRFGSRRVPGDPSLSTGRWHERRRWAPAVEERPELLHRIRTDEYNDYNLWECFLTHRM